MLQREVIGSRQRKIPVVSLAATLTCSLASRHIRRRGWKDKMYIVGGFSQVIHGMHALSLLRDSNGF